MSNSSFFSRAMPLLLSLSFWYELGDVGRNYVSCSASHFLWKDDTTMRVTTIFLFRDGKTALVRNQDPCNTVCHCDPWNKFDGSDLAKDESGPYFNKEDQARKSSWYRNITSRKLILPLRNPWIAAWVHPYSNALSLAMPVRRLVFALTFIDTFLVILPQF